MKTFIIGGTGLIGSSAAVQLIARGHEVSALALHPHPEPGALPPEMHLSYGSYLTMADDELHALLDGCEGLVFAAGVDERVEGPAPIYEMYRRYNIDPLRRILPIARACGIRHVVICGSYFSYFDKVWPDRELSRRHPYIRSRIEQEQVALSFARGATDAAAGAADDSTAGDSTAADAADDSAAGDRAADGLDVAVLELPYIFGAQPGRKPVWVFLVQMIRAQKLVTFWPRGGTAMCTVRQVGQAVAGALESNRGGTCYPIGFYNMTWKQLLSIIHRHMGYQHRGVITIPDWMFDFVTRRIYRDQQARGIEGGLDMRCFSEVECENTFIDRSLGCDLLGVEPDDIDAAIGQSVRLSLDILDGKSGDIVSMRGE